MACKKPKKSALFSPLFLAIIGISGLLLLAIIGVGGAFMAGIIGNTNVSNGNNNIIVSPNNSNSNVNSTNPPVQPKPKWSKYPAENLRWDAPTV